ncbi:unnamed protein product [Clonostachys byssicola]|uniref:Uncharacterized protein n=1 Tax=Clonostachys byssicola TaxID=160290 RepID=A0A9N9UWC5_9HYPO|nr:unnamed protein product [Clonostachys byssicola]
MPPETRSAKQRQSPEETPDIAPPRTLTSEEAEKDYQIQLALLREQTQAYHDEQRQSRNSTAKETPDSIPPYTFASEEAEQDYQIQLALLREQTQAYHDKQKQSRNSTAKDKTRPAPS